MRAPTQRLCARVGVVISNNSDSGALRRAREAGVRTAHLSSATHPDADALDRAISDALDAGERRPRGAGRIHETPGAGDARALREPHDQHASVVVAEIRRQRLLRPPRARRGASRTATRESGATVHWVTGDYDSGPIIAQARVPVAADETPETLEHKVKAVERQLLIDTLRSLADRPSAPSPHRTREHQRESFACASRHCSAIRTA